MTQKNQVDTLKLDLTFFISTDTKPFLRFGHKNKDAL